MANANWPRRTWSVVWLGWVAGCVEVGLTEVHDFDADDVGEVEVRIARGDVQVQGGQGRQGRLTLRAWGRGGSELIANERAETVVVDWGIEAGRMSVSSPAVLRQGGLDVGLRTRADVDLDLRTETGRVTVREVRGRWAIDGGQVVADALEGEGRLRAGQGASVELWPYLDGAIVVEVTGDTLIALPAGGPYDIVVDGDVNASMTVQDLGFDVLDRGPGYLSAVSGAGTSRIDVRVRSGAFTLVESVR